MNIDYTPKQLEEILNSEQTNRISHGKIPLLKNRWTYRESNQELIYYTDYHSEGYGVNSFNQWFVNDEWFPIDNITRVYATTTQIHEMFVFQLENRYGNDWQNRNLKKCLVARDQKSSPTKKYNVVINIQQNRIWNKYSCIYKNGIWLNDVID